MDLKRLAFYRAAILKTDLEPAVGGVELSDFVSANICNYNTVYVYFIFKSLNR
jgi:hypothetical protein